MLEQAPVIVEKSSIDLQQMAAETLVCMAVIDDDLLGYEFSYNGKPFRVTKQARSNGVSGVMVVGCPVKTCTDETCARIPTFVNHVGMANWKRSYAPGAPQGKVGIQMRKSFKNAIWKKREKLHRRPPPSPKHGGETLHRKPLPTPKHGVLSDVFQVPIVPWWVRLCK